MPKLWLGHSRGSRAAAQERAPASAARKNVGMGWRECVGGEGGTLRMHMQ